MSHLKLNTAQWLQLGSKLGYIKKAQEEADSMIASDSPEMPVAAPGIPEMEDPGALCMQFKLAGAGSPISAFIDTFSNGDTSYVWLNSLDSFGNESKEFINAWDNKYRVGLFNFIDNGMKLCKNTTRGQVNQTIKDYGYIVFKMYQLPVSGIPFYLYKDLTSGTKYAEMSQEEFVQHVKSERGEESIPALYLRAGFGLTGSEFTEYQKCSNEYTCP